MVTPSRRQNWLRLYHLFFIPLFLFFIFLILFYINAHFQFSIFTIKQNPHPTSRPTNYFTRRKEILVRSRIAVCLVGGARRFELTGPLIVKNVLREYPNVDLFLNSWVDENSYKFVLLGNVSRIASVQILGMGRIEETEAERRVLSSKNSPNGIQGLLQYFRLVEGCQDRVRAHEYKTNTTYDWIVRTRVDGYWSAPLFPFAFNPSAYVIPKGSHFGGLNDRFGIGTPSVSSAALSRLSLIPQLDSCGYRNLNSESAFKAQLEVTSTNYKEMQVPFCIISDRKYAFPPATNGVPVMSMRSAGALNGAKCRPCRSTCRGKCADEVLVRLDWIWGWTSWENGEVEICDASGDWEGGWEEVFDEVAGNEAAEVRRRVGEMSVEECLVGWEVLMGKVKSWEGPKGEEVCRIGGSRG